MEWIIRSLCLFFFLFSVGIRADFNSLRNWDLVPQNQPSLDLEPIRETAITEDGLRLGLKHYSRPGAKPVLLLHGIATNDRQWDVIYPKKSNFARFLYSQGYDVWIGNFRGFGTEGFRSESPEDYRNWTIDDYAVYDIPAMVDLIRKKTSQPIWLIAHSLGAYAVEGYLAGLQYSDEGEVYPARMTTFERKESIRGVVALAGVHNFWWANPLADAAYNPISTLTDYYKSNYELELLAGTRPLYYLVPRSWSFPLGSSIQAFANFSLDQIPFIGSRLQSLYNGLLNQVTGNPLMNVFYHISNMDRETMRIYFKDGMENVPFTVLEQLGNTVANRQSQSYYHLHQPDSVYNYGDVRKKINLPVLFVAGGHDRLTSSEMIYQDGYLENASTDKSWLHVEESGHEDLLIGKNALNEVMIPVALWLEKH